MAREKESTIIERYQVFMEDETGPGKLLAYGIASVGLFIALYRIKPLAKFKKPSDVPFQFLKSRIPLQGTVMLVESNSNALLMVNHQPLLPFPFFNKSYLPVKISNVEVTANGISWLQSVVNGNHIIFIPIVKEKEYLECIVSMKQKDQDTLKIGEELVKLGLGTINEPWIKDKDKYINMYKESLIKAQIWAARRRNGCWHFIKQPTILWKIQMYIIDRMKSLLPAYIVKKLNL